MGVASPVVSLMVAFGAAFLMFHALICLYAIANPDAVASVVASPNRTFLAWVYLSSLQIGRNDPEMDLVQSGLPRDALAANCRRRGLMGVAGSVFAIVMLLIFVVPKLV